MKLKLELQDIRTSTAEEVLVGLVVCRRWETANGEPVGPALKERSPSVLVELAHIAYVRKHGQPISLVDFEDRFDVEVVRGAGASEAEEAEPANPSEPATVPPSA